MSDTEFNKLRDTNTTCEKTISGFSHSCKIIARIKHSFLFRFFDFSKNCEQVQEVAATSSKATISYKNDLLIDEVSEEIALLARTNYNSLVRIFNEHSLAFIADRLLLPRTCVHRIRNGTELQRMATLLASVEYTVVGKNQAVYDIDYVKSLEVLAHKNLSSINKAQS